MSHAVYRKIDPGLLVVIDVLETADEDAVFAELKRRFRKAGLVVYDAVQHQQRTNQLQQEADVPAATDAVFVDEPSHALIGRSLREDKHLPPDQRNFDSEAEIAADAADRSLQFSVLTLPFLRRQGGRIVVQNRGLISSVARFSTRYARWTPERLVQFDGNKPCMDRPPDYVFIIRRQDDAARKTPFDYELVRRMRDDHSLHDPFLRLGTKIRQVDAEAEPSAIAKRIITDIEPFLTARKSS